MPYRQMPQFKSVPDKILEIAQPAIGGLNLKDLEFEQEVNQSPYMLNVMYRNGAFGKRYGQSLLKQADDIDLSFEGEVYSITSYKDDIIIHSGTKMYKYKQGQDPIEIGSGFPEEKGLFIIFSQKLYYLSSNGFYEYTNSFSPIVGYIPDFMINCEPDGSYGGDVVEDLNVMGSKFTLTFNGRNGVAEYQVGKYDTGLIDWDIRPKIEVDTSETTNFTVDKTNKKITFATAPQEGNMNVIMTFTLKADTFTRQREEILSCKYYDMFGGSDNSRLFLAGNGKSKYYYSHAYDVTYWPENNYATIGNTEDDITGFGRQYNVLIVFKPREVYSIYSYIQTQSSTLVEKDIGSEGFKSQLVNARVGCDAPYSIQLINNLLTWYNSKEGVCTLVSTNIQDERNVRLLSRNIDRSKSFGTVGLLDHDEDLNAVRSADFDNKYFLVFPESGHCYIWDYEISPYRYSSNGETNPRQLDWFLFDKFYVKDFLKFNKELIYSTSNESFNMSLVKLNNSFADLDFDGDGENDPINSYYMTPFLQFGAVEYLKNVKNIYVQCRGDTSSVIDMYYYTEENINPEEEPEAIRIGGKLWAHFQWSNFQWLIINWANTFRRKCNLKKIQMTSFFFTNNEIDRDMSITHIGLQYQLVKYVR